MERPFVVCHMLASLDGKIDGEFFGLPQAAQAIKTYDLIKRAVHGDQENIEAYLLHYDSYINSLVMYDEVGPDGQLQPFTIPL